MRSQNEKKIHCCKTKRSLQNLRALVLSKYLKLETVDRCSMCILIILYTAYINVQSHSNVTRYEKINGDYITAYINP